MPWTVEEVGKSALKTKMKLDSSFLQLLKRFTFEYPRVNAIADASCIDEPVRALYNCIVRKYVLSLSKVAVQFDAKESEMNVIVNIRVVLQNQTTAVKSKNLPIVSSDIEREFWRWYNSSNCTCKLLIILILVTMG